MAESINRIAKATPAQKSAALEWLRGQALAENNPAWFHAAVAMQELTALNARLGVGMTQTWVTLVRVNERAAWCAYGPMTQIEALAFQRGTIGMGIERQVAHLVPPPPPPAPPPPTNPGREPSDE